MNWMRNLKWNLMLIRMDINLGLTALVVFLVVVLSVCFAVNYGMACWQDHEAVKWNVEHHRR